MTTTGRNTATGTYGMYNAIADPDVWEKDRGVWVDIRAYFKCDRKQTLCADCRERGVMCVDSRTRMCAYLADVHARRLAVEARLEKNLDVFTWSLLLDMGGDDALRVLDHDIRCRVSGKFGAAAAAIWKHWEAHKRDASDPSRPKCIRRLLHEFASLLAEN